MLNTGKLAGKTIYITGCSRGIGKSIGLKAARDGANIVVAAKTAEPHPKLPGTIYTAAKEIEAAGGQALPVIVDVREEGAIQESIETAVKQFGGIDIVINNASAISLTGTQETEMKRYDLMHSINTRGTYLVSKCALPYLKQSASLNRNPHILNISPPLNLNPRWFRDHVAYTMAKYGMSMCVLGMAEEFKPVGIAANALWPQTAIITAAMEMLGGEAARAQCRTVDIMSDAAYVMLTRDARYFTGNFAIDEAILREEGVVDFEQYACVPGSSLIPDFFLDEVDDPLDVVSSGVEGQAKARFVGGVDTQKAAPAPPPPAAAAPPAGEGSPIDQLFGKMAAELNESLVSKTKATFTFNVTGDGAGKYFLDLKNGAGACGKGEATGGADCTMTMSSNNFTKMFSGKMSPTSAFMTGKLKIEGNMGKAMKLEKLMGKMQKRGFHTQARNNSLSGYGSVRHFSDSGPTYQEVEQVFAKLKEVASPEIVSKVDAVFVFDVEGKGKWHVNYKSGSGTVGQGEPEEKADVTLTLNQENFLKMFNRELKPATAFMSGKLKLSGDLAKAMALEAVMKATREKGFHTWAAQRRTDLPKNARSYSVAKEYTYTTIPQVFDRISLVSDEDIVSKVKAVFVFDVEDEEKYYVDLKQGSGQVGKGDPPVKSDVSFVIGSETLLRMFNRELTPANAFMTGKLKVTGDFSKALALETVMKAAREAGQ